MEEFQFDTVSPEPLIIENSEYVDWRDEADVVVVGFGGAGASAAIEAADHGLKVIAIDRFDGGGATAFSGGINYAGGGTRAQRDAGVSDSVDEMVKYLTLEVGNAVKRETLERYCQESSAMIDWLLKLGVRYDGPTFDKKVAYPPEGYFLYYSGNENSSQYKKYSVPAPRGHRAVGQGFTGSVMYAALEKAAKERGVIILPHSPTSRLVVGTDRHILGVEICELPSSTWKKHQMFYNRVAPLRPFKTAIALQAGHAATEMEKQHGVPKLIRARRGVVLSTGGFAYNREMMETHAPLIANHLKGMMPLNSLGCTGSGIRLGTSVGGAVKGLGNLYLGLNMAPPEAYLNGVIVNKEGRRFVNESAYNSNVGAAIAEQAYGEARLILSYTQFKKAIYQCLFSGWQVFRYFGAPALLNILFGGTRCAWTLRKLAEKCHMDPAVLDKTVTDYNLLDKDDEFGKSRDTKAHLSAPGFVAVNFSFSNKFAFTQIFTMGGLVVDEQTGMVLRGDGTAITGLYAAGRTAYGLCSNRYISGLSIGDCVFTGRRAARHISLQSDETFPLDPSAL